MRVPKAVAALALGLLVSASTAHAQGAEFSLGGGIDNPLGDFNDAAKLGFHGLAAVSFVPTGSPVGFQVDGNYSQFSDDTPLDVKFQMHLRHRQRGLQVQDIGGSPNSGRT